LITELNGVQFFVSWAANQAGVLNDKIPKFAGVAI
jgi:hypothetical protein